MSNEYYVYVLKSLEHNFHYIGHTQSLKDRLKIHNKKKIRSTKAYTPFVVIYSEIYYSHSEAFNREMYLKQAEGNIWLRNHLIENKLW